MKIYQLTLSLLATLILSSSLLFAQATTDHFVYLKTSSGILTGVIVHDNSWISNLKINSFCAIQKLTTGNSCQYIPSDSPLAKDPNKALKFVNRDPNTDPSIIQKLQNDLNALANQLKLANNRGGTPNNYQQYNLENAAVDFDPIDSQPVTIADNSNTNNNTTNNTNNNNTQTTPSVPQFNSPVVLPDINASSCSSCLSCYL